MGGVASDLALEEAPSHLVLELVEPYLSTLDICNARSTCTGWKAIFTPSLLRRRRRPLELYNRPRLSVYHDISKFVEGMKGSTDVPFDNYRLWFDFGVDSATLGGTRPFFTTPSISQSVRKLQINRFQSKTVDTGLIREVLFKFTPNLEELHLDLKVYLEKPHSSMPVHVAPANEEGASFWAPIPNLRRLNLSLFQERADHRPLLTDLIRGAVNLEELTLGDHCNLAALRAIRDHNADCRQTLKILSMDGLTVRDLTVLVQLGTALELHEFRTNLRNSFTVEGNVDLFRSFLASQGESLRVLRINHGPGPGSKEAAAIRFPYMPKLHSLTYVGRTEEKQDSPRQIPYDELLEHGAEALHHILAVELEKPTFSLNFPNLRALEGGQLIPTLIQGQGGGGSQVLRLDWTQAVEMPGTFAQIAANFPKLTEFRATLRELHLLPEIWTLFPRLEVLHILIEEERNKTDRSLYYLDELVTGIPKSQFKFLLRDIRNGAVDHRNWAGLKTQPGISDLKELRDFKLFRNNVMSRWFLTEISKTFALGAPASSKLRRFIIQDGGGQNRRN